MTETEELRRANLNAFFVRKGWVSAKTPDRGSPAKLVELLGRTSSFWSDRLGGTRPIKADLAREIEEAVDGLNQYDLDRISQLGETTEKDGVSATTVNLSSGTTSQLAPVLAWASLGVDLFKEANDVEAIGFAPVPRGASALVKWFVVDQDHRRFGITKGDMVALDPLTGTDKPEEMKRHVFKTASGQFILAEYRTLAGDSFEALPDSGTALEKERHGLVVVARVRGVWEA